MYDIDHTARTFRLRNIGGLVVTGGAFADDVSYGEPDMDRAWTSFSDGSDGYVKSGSHLTLQTEEGSLSTLAEVQAIDAIHGHIF